MPERLHNGRPSTVIGEKDKNEKKYNEAEDKPEKFLDEKHEKHWELENHIKKLIMRIERADITKHVENYNPEVTEKYIFKNPVTYAAREAGVKENIFNATGIPPINSTSLEFLYQRKG